MYDYAVLEAAVIQRLITAIPDLSDTRCLAGNLDGVLNAMFIENENHGCVVEFLRGQYDPESPFKAPVWVWQILGIYFIRYTGNTVSIETELRNLLPKLAALFHDDHTLGGLSARFRVMEIDTPEPAQINDVPIYWLPFRVDVFDRI